MIIWDFNVIVALLLSLSLAVVVGCWLFYTLYEGRQEVTSSRPYIRQCGFCSYVYLDYFKKVHGTCPRCGSYLED